MGKRWDLVELYRLQGGFVFVSVCRLLEKKGIDHAIGAFAAVHARHPECRYVIVGTGPYEDALRRCAAATGAEAGIVFAGEVADDDLVAHYCLGDVFVMPNRELANGDTEGFGLVFLEANSCGIPVIAGRDGGSRDAVQDGVNGLIVDGGSIDDIAAAMLALREDDALREGLRSRALQIAGAADWRGKAEAFLQLCTGAEPS
jgi:phosphatidylinositol alpha-1,6-mannosyltransferase